LIAASCGENKTADSRESQQQLTSSNRSQNASARNSPAQKSANPDQPVPPKDAQFTIFCTKVDGPGHVQRAKQLKDELLKGTNMKDWYVTHSEQQSTLYYGYYKSFNDPKETARIQADRAKLATMQDAVGNRPFGEALPVSIASPDPTAPPEFNLENAKGFWSLAIAAYQGPERKEKAVESVKEARKMGVEAYYHHGPNVSEVCVGAWPEEAIRKQEFDGGQGIDQADRDRPLLVLGPGAEIPQPIKRQYANGLIDKDTGKPLQLLEQKVEVVDPTMRAAMEKYPTHSVNGYDDTVQARDPKTGKMVTIYKDSMIVPIPKNESALTGGQDTVRPGLLAPAPMTNPNTGRLRSVGP
jgi:hypothetical protein